MIRSISGTSNPVMLTSKPRSTVRRFCNSGEDRFIPASLLGQPIVGNDLRADLIWRQITEANGWDFRQSEKLRRLNSSMTGDDRVALPIRKRESSRAGQLLDR
jgi:hypothetical protein